VAAQRTRFAWVTMENRAQPKIDRWIEVGLAIFGGHEIVPGGGHVAARWRPTVLPSGGQLVCLR
jgi:hypothetical protein